MSDVPFTQALRAELEAVIARYEALVQAQQQWAASSHTREMESRLGELRVIESERDQLRAQAGVLEAKIEHRDREIASLRERVQQEERRAQEATSQAAASLAEARQKIAELTTQLDLVAEGSRVFEETFAAEVAFVKACTEIHKTALLDAIEEKAGNSMEASPSVYGSLKQERLDVVLTHAVRLRARSALDAPLSDVERQGLRNLASAAGCELIEPELGARYLADEMDKVATASDPSEEGNVLACLVPGLRLTGSEGALVFPKVKVAVG